MNPATSALILSLTLTSITLFFPFFFPEAEVNSLVDCGRTIERASFALDRTRSISELRQGIECLNKYDYDKETFEYQNLSSIWLSLKETDRIDSEVRFSLEKTSKMIANRAFEQRFIDMLILFPLILGLCLILAVLILELDFGQK